MLDLLQSYTVDKKDMVQPYCDGNLHVHCNVQGERLTIGATYGVDGYGEAVNPVEYKFDNFIKHVISNFGSIDYDDNVIIEKTDTNYLFVSKFLSVAHRIFNECRATDEVSEEEE